jgi:hypothetical protein
MRRSSYFRDTPCCFLFGTSAVSVSCSIAKGWTLYARIAGDSSPAFFGRQLATTLRQQDAYMRRCRLLFRAHTPLCPIPVCLAHIPYLPAVFLPLGVGVVPGMLLVYPRAAPRFWTCRACSTSLFSITTCTLFLCILFLADKALSPGRATVHAQLLHRALRQARHARTCTCTALLHSRACYADSIHAAGCRLAASVATAALFLALPP